MELLCTHYYNNLLLLCIGGISKKQKISEIVKAELLNPQFVNLQNIPELLMSRNGLNNTNLFIRSCYNDIYEEIKTDLSTFEQKHKQPNFAVIGTAGIGKSSFFLYFLWKYMEDQFFMKDRNGDKSFFYQTSNTSVDFYLHTKEHEFISRVLNFAEYDELKSKKYPLFADMETVNYPFRNHGLLIIFSSFKPDRYKERTKLGFIKLMPTWSYEEMSDFILSESFGTDFGKTLEERKSMLEQFEYFGGSIRSVIRKNVDTIQKAIDEKGQSICENYFTAGHGGIETDISDVLIHRNPPKDINGKFVYEVLDRPFIYSFASQYVFTKLVKENKEAVIKKAKQKYSAGTMFGGEDGKEFEWLCLHVCTFSDLAFDADPLIGTEGLDSLNITFPNSEYLPRDWRTVDNYLRENVLYLPITANVASGDAFCVMELNNVITLIVLQVTISPTHGIKMHGLQTIFERFDTSDVKIANGILLFVTPHHGRLTHKQNLTTEKKKVEDINIPENIKPFAKNQFKMEYAFE